MAQIYACPEWLHFTLLEKFKETGDSRHIYKNKLDKACFQHDMAYGYFKDLPKKNKFR